MKCRALRAMLTAPFGLIALSAWILPCAASGAEATVAVATNFRDVAESLQAAFERASDHRIRLVAGSTGKLYAQVRSGAPFDAFLAADQARPMRLEKDGAAVPRSRFTYAIGVLTLWSADPALLRSEPARALTSSRVRHVAIANPALAPYGDAARQALVTLGLWDAVSGKVVVGQNVGEAYAMVATCNAEAGFVALSSVLGARSRISGSRWDVPAELHAPIRQDAVLLRRGKGNEAAAAFLEYLRTPAARAAIRQAGYRTD